MRQRRDPYCVPPEPMVRVPSRISSFELELLAGRFGFEGEGRSQVTAKAPMSRSISSKISTTPNATPKSTPPSSTGSRGGADDRAGDEQLIWRSLVPRLVHPARLQIVEALIDRGEPMSAAELAPLVPVAEGNIDLVRYHAKAMTKAGALEVVDAERPQAGAGPAELTFFLALPRGS